MASSYPGALDALTNPISTDAMNSVTVPHATQHADINDAIEAVQGELGTDPAGASVTVKARLDTLDTTVGGKAPSADPTFTGTVVLPSTTSVGTVSSTEIGYLDGLTEALTTSLAGKLATPGAFTSYTPTLGNWTKGDGVLTGYYMQVGRWRRVYIFLVCGSTTVFSSYPTFTLPVDLSGNAGEIVGGASVCRDVSSGGNYPGQVMSVGYSTVTPMIGYPSSIPEPTVPFTWASGDKIHMAFDYEGAS